MFPHIHHERGNEAGYISIFMQTDPVIGESATVWIQITNGPADSSHLPHAGKIQFPHVIGAETVLCCFQKRRALIGLLGPSFGQILKLIFVQDHPIVFKP